MRGIKNYTCKEWIKFDPPIWYLKEIRNKLISRKFVNTHPKTLAPFLEKYAHLKGKNIGMVVAFNSPWVIKNLLPAMKIYLTDAEIIVCDNSNNLDLRPEIEAACKVQNVPYFSLPNNPESHPCRSHGISLNWIYYNIIQSLEPRMFACLDHDLIPFREINLADLLGSQSVYGIRYASPWAWYLWAGYCMYNFEAVRDKKLDFNNDRPSHLDTGGQNWKPLNRHIDTTKSTFAQGGELTLKHPDSNETLKCEMLDNAWLHLRGIGQTKGRQDKFSHKVQFYTNIFDQVSSGKSLTDFIDDK